MNVLLVENNSAQADKISVFLREHGFAVYWAREFSDVLPLLVEGPIDVILLDLAMPDSSGLQTFWNVRGVSALPIVVLTDLNDSELAVEAIKNGAQDYLVKGVVSMDSVVRCLIYAIERTGVEKALRKEQHRLKTILDNSYDAFISTDSDWHITDWNARAERTFGWKREDVIGKPLVSIIPDHLQKQLVGSIESYFMEERDGVRRATRELFGIHRNGHRFPIEIGMFRVQEDLAYVFCAFVRDITEQKRSSEELEHLVQARTVALTQSNEQLRQFAKIASHDLQEPLRAVEGFANLLAESTEGKLEKDPTEFIEYIIDGTKRMQELVRSVLIHSQITCDEIAKPVSCCASVMEEVLVGLAGPIRESGAKLDIGKLPRVGVAREQLVQLFSNLINNSIKYRSLESPHIAINAKRIGDMWLFSVSDNGIGIDPQYADKIFDMFARLHGKSQYPGTGIGLAICKKVVTSHGGTIWVESKLNQGAVFLFTLPVVSKLRRNKMSKTISLLLVEDTPSDVRLTQEALKRSDISFELKVSIDGVEAMDFLNEQVSSGGALPDIILLDLNMPKKNGHEVLEEIQANDNLRDIPVVLLTVSERDEDVMEALRLKMNYYVAKPVTAQKLSTLIKAIYELSSGDAAEANERREDDSHVRLVLAGNPHTAAIALSKLALDPSVKVRRRVAENANTPAQALSRLARDSDAEVRIGVCDNKNSDLSILEGLAVDKCEEVRLELSSIARLPVYLLNKLAADENTFVSENAKKTLKQCAEKI
ncbi:MAG: response regulator [Candidatus Obscuribacterales bacterium]|nr:response regulator [Candidatus Obscuribacterales bacterium]